jgi:transposase
VATSAVTGRHDLADRQWAVPAPLLPAASSTGRPPTWEKRPLIDGIRRRIRIGAPWRGVPAGYAPWPTVYGLFRDGTWDRILSALQARGDAQGRIDWTVDVDPMTSRAHQHAAGLAPMGICRRSHPAGCTRIRPITGWAAPGGGPTTKTHLACEPVLVLADKARTSRANRRYLRSRGITACIPATATRTPTARARLPWRPPADIRPAAQPAPPRRRERHRPTQTPPRSGLPLRQARRPLPSSPVPGGKWQTVICSPVCAARVGQFRFPGVGAVAVGNHPRPR